MDCWNVPFPLFPSFRVSWSRTRYLDHTISAANSAPCSFPECAASEEAYFAGAEERQNGRKGNKRLRSRVSGCDSFFCCRVAVGGLLSFRRGSGWPSWPLTPAFGRGQRAIKPMEGRRDSNYGDKARQLAPLKNGLVQVCTEQSALPSFGRMLGRLVQVVRTNGRRALCVLRAALLPVTYSADSIARCSWKPEHLEGEAWRCSPDLKSS